MIKIISWNINHRSEPWQKLLDSPDVDIALLQEAQQPALNIKEVIPSSPWHTGDKDSRRPWCAAIARFSDRVTMQPYKLGKVGTARSDELRVSLLGTLAAAKVTLASTGEVITLISMYGAWESPLEDTSSNWIYADAAVHRLISDISVLIGRQKGHKIIASGDLNLLHGYGENGSPYWKQRYDTVFARMEALGLSFVGPQEPNGQQANPWPGELPEGSLNVPTYRTKREDPTTATRQLDFVFASNSLKDRVCVRALNGKDEWGPSDHCRVSIELKDA